MSVTITQGIFLRPWSGFSEPQFPVGIWWVFVTLLGDASGGSRSLVVEFKPANAQGVPRLYNLEQIQVSDTDRVTKDGDLIFNGWDILPGEDSAGGAPQSPGMSLRLVASPIAGANLDGRFLAPLPLLLGLPTAFLANTAVQIRFANVDADSIRTKLHGYYWDARSFQVTGGPQRPPGGLWG